MTSYKVVGVKFPGGGKEYFFDPNNISLKKGNLVLVNNASGPAPGKVVTKIKTVSEKDIVFPLKEVIRKLSKEENNLNKPSTIPTCSTSYLLLEDELTTISGVPLTYITTLLNMGLPHYVIGKEIRFLEEEAIDWIENNISIQQRLEWNFC